MRFIPIANVAQKNVNRMTEPREEIAAIMGSVPAMEEEIGVRSGAAPGAGIFKTNLYTGEASAAADKAYGEALTRALPQYVNAYRAYLEEQKKKTTSGGGTTSPYTSSYAAPPTLPPVTAYLPTRGYVPDVNRNVLYGTSPYGAMPMGTIPKPGPQPASRVLAQRRVTSTRGKAGIE